jgi:tetratricopeptide (TPR) repeat protein
MLAFMGGVIATCGCARSPQENEARYLKRAEEFVAKKDYASALIEYRNAAQQMPKDAEPYYRMGLAYMEQNSIGAAVTAYRKAIELNPQHVDARLKLAELMASSAAQSDIQVAEKQMRELLAFRPNSTDARNVLAVAELRLGKVDDAVKLLEEALEISPVNLRSSVNLARVKLARGDRTGAERALREAVSNNPQSPEAALALSSFLLSSGKLEEAENEARRAIALNSKFGAGYVALARTQLAHNRADEAEKTLRAVATLPDERYQHLHASFLFERGRREEAIKEFEALLARNDASKATRARLVQAYVAVNRIRDAESVLNSALKKDRTDIDALVQRGELLLMTGNTRAAEQDINEALRFNPSVAEAHALKAQVYRRQNRPAGEREELNEALALKPRLLAVRLLLARNLMAANEYTAALRLLDEATDAEKDVLQLVIERNRALLALQRYPELRASLEEALSVSRAPELLVQSAMLKSAEKNYAAARTTAEQVLEREPQNIQALRLIADSYTAENQPDKALRALETAVAKNPGSAAVQHLFGAWALAGGNRVKARSAFEAALAADRTFIPASLALAEMDLAEKEFDSARRRLDALILANPRLVPALVDRAAVENAAGNRGEAAVRYRAVLQIDPGNLKALNDLAYILASTQSDDALRHALRALEIAPDNAAVLDTVGWIYYHQGAYNTALAYFRQAVAKHSSPRRQYHLALCYLKLGEERLGRDLMAKAVESDPDLVRNGQ